MKTIPLSAVPAQTFDVPLSGNTWTMVIRSMKGGMFGSFYKNGDAIILNTRIVPGQRILPCRYQEDGNFALITQNYAAADYTEFGTSQFMVYADADEIADYRDLTYTPVTTDFFDSNGGLPLAFSPDGYAIAEPAPPPPPAVYYLTAPDGMEVYTPDGDPVYYPGA